MMQPACMYASKQAHPAGKGSALSVFFVLTCTASLADEHTQRVNAVKL